MALLQKLELLGPRPAPGRWTTQRMARPRPSARVARMETATQTPWTRRRQPGELPGCLAPAMQWPMCSMNGPTLTHRVALSGCRPPKSGFGESRLSGQEEGYCLCRQMSADLHFLVSETLLLRRAPTLQGHHRGITGGRSGLPVQPWLQCESLKCSAESLGCISHL